MCIQASQSVMKEIWTAAPSKDSLDKAISACIKPSNQGDMLSQYHLSRLYALKNNNHENEISYHWTLKAAENGHPYSQFYLGTMYENGIVVEQNSEKANEWYQKAANNGFQLAQKKLEEKD